jgi:hypothetical protein
MTKKKATPKKSRGSTTARPGPKPDLLKVEGDWEDAVRQSLEKKKPAGGWPK